MTEALRGLAANLARILDSQRDEILRAVESFDARTRVESGYLSIEEYEAKVRRLSDTLDDITRRRQAQVAIMKREYSELLVKFQHLETSYEEEITVGRLALEGMSIGIKFIDEIVRATSNVDATDENFGTIRYAALTAESKMSVIRHRARAMASFP